MTVAGAGATVLVWTSATHPVPPRSASASVASAASLPRRSGCAAFPGDEGSRTGMVISMRFIAATAVPSGGAGARRRRPAPRALMV
ncbi:hypothetical protein BE11_45650 [Sorangium cellulosum]|nr:hypothetical protein BE11_45650 [Sorangium cellulosum]